MAGSPESDKNAIAQELGDPLMPTEWPPPLAHCGQPLSQSTDEWITVAEITSEPANGYKGNRLLYTALIPKADVSAVLLGDHLKTGHLWSLQNRPLWMA